MAGETIELQYDITVVGAGVAGCYVAYRLLHGSFNSNSPIGALQQQNGGALSVGLYEYSGRVGGRLLSAPLPNAPAQGDTNPDYLRDVEFGGFRFQPQMHIVRDLATLLQLDDQPFPVDEPLNNPVLLRGTSYSKRDLTSTKIAQSYKVTTLELDIISGKYAINGVPDLDTYVANIAFQDVLPSGDGSQYGLPTKYAPMEGMPNGWFLLQQAYATAFNAGSAAELAGNQPLANQEWAKVQQYQREYEQKKQQAMYKGRRFIDWAWWALRSDILSSEALAFEEDSGGYNSFYSSGNGPQGIIENFYFSNQRTTKDGSKFVPVSNPDDPRYQVPPLACTATVWKHISDGYAAIPNQLFTEFQSKGGNIPKGATNHLDTLNRQLISFSRSGNGGYQLLFFKRESNQAITSAQALALMQSEPEAFEIVNTRFLILALPKHSLDLIDQNNFFFQNRTVQALMDTVIRIPAQRLFMAYPTPWWTAQPQKDGEPVPECGRSTTDLGVRQFYYWLTSKQNGPSTVLASYTNGRAEEYWRGVQSATEQTFDDLRGARAVDQFQPGENPPNHNLEQAYPQGRGPRAATKAMADLAHKQLMAVVGVTDAPQPIYAHFQDWEVDPWGAGWHAWKSGADDDSVIPQIMQPIDNEQIYICGECWSNVQGWVQGALNSSETLLQSKLGLQWPSWLQQGGTWLGPGSDS